MKGLFDTNILIDYLTGHSQAKKELTKFETVIISIISWIEVMVGVNGEKEEEIIRNFLSRFQIIDINQEIAEKAVSIRKKRKIRLPDALIWASAIETDCLLVTRNIKDFPADDPGIRIPYSF